MLIEIKVNPKAKLNKISKLDGTHYHIYTTAPPEKGKANKEAIKLLAKEFGVSKSRVEILKGLTNREKLVKVDL
ncbi:MAG: DUF167 domain-containing protein [Candidatus Kuenenbacteria bacterium]